MSYAYSCIEMSLSYKLIFLHRHITFVHRDITILHRDVTILHTDDTFYTEMPNPYIQISKRFMFHRMQKNSVIRGGNQTWAAGSKVKHSTTSL